MRLDGSREDLAQFACGTRNYKEYHPWIDLTTWVGPCVDLGPRDQIDDPERHLLPNDIAIYIGTVLDLTEFQTFLVAEATNDGSF